MTRMTADEGIQFQDRRAATQEAIIVLAGYKQYAWEQVFGRLERFAPPDIDVVVVSAGVFNDELSAICARNNWSYLSIAENNVTLVLNTVICLIPDAELIWKIDEDMLLTASFFGQVRAAHDRALVESKYEVGFTTPLINVNGYSYLRILEKTGLIEAYEARFGRAYYGSLFPNAVQQIQGDSEAAKFLWGWQSGLPPLDELDALFAGKPFEYSVCPQRFSIGAILLPRSTWEQMGGFTVIEGKTNLGLDEEDLCNHCMDKSRAIIVSENTVVGHLGFQPQGATMQQFFLGHPEVFALRELTSSGDA
jgi:hypothetical protein